MVGHELRFRAMGTDAHVLVVGGRPEHARRARATVERLERRWSRFLPDSEISRLNAAAGDPVLVSDVTFDLIALAMEGKRISGGAFDPLLLPAVRAAGYDRSFDALDPDVAPQAPGPHPRGDVEFDAALRLCRLPAGAAFDPGGIGKGLAADIVAAELLDAGARGVLANIGGDLRVAGEPPLSDAWLIDVEHPLDGTLLARVALVDGAVATSSPRKRAWRQRGVRRHHLIDAASGLPAESDLASVTAIASQGWLAEVAAKTVFFAADRPVDALGALGVTGLIVRGDGAVEEGPGFARFAA